MSSSQADSSRTGEFALSTMGIMLAFAAIFVKELFPKLTPRILYNYAAFNPI